MERRGYNFILLTLVSIAYAIMTILVINSVVKNGDSLGEFRATINSNVLVIALVAIAILYVVEAILSFLCFRTVRKFYVNLGLLVLLVVVVLVIAIGWYSNLLYQFLLIGLLIYQKKKMNLID